MEKSLNFRKNFIWNILGTGFNAFNSLFLMIIVTRVNGVDEAGIFTIAFATACILYVIGTYAGRVFQVTESNKDISDKDYILNRVMSFILMMVCTVLFVVFRGYDSYKSTIFILLAVYKGLEAFSDVLYGIMQKNDLLYKVGQSFFIKALLTVGVFAIVDILTKDLILSCLSIIIVWLLVILTYDFYNTRKLIDLKSKINYKNAIKIFKTGFFVFAITFLGLYISNAPKYAIDSYLENSAQTIFGIIIMPATAITLFGQFILHPYLTSIFELYRKNKIKELKQAIRKLILYISGVGAACLVGAYLIGIPVLNFIYGISLDDYKWQLLVIIVGATLYNIGGAYYLLLTTIRKTFVQFVMYVIISILAIVISNILTKAYAITGATSAYFILMLLYMVFYAAITYVILGKKTKKQEES